MAKMPFPKFQMKKSRGVQVGVQIPILTTCVGENPFHTQKVFVLDLALRANSALQLVVGLDVKKWVLGSVAFSQRACAQRIGNVSADCHGTQQRLCKAIPFTEPHKRLLASVSIPSKTGPFPILGHRHITRLMTSRAFMVLCESKVMQYLGMNLPWT